METLFYELYHNLPRQGPGNTAATQRAYACLKDLPVQPSTVLNFG
jgi:hypothetical protein